MRLSICIPTFNRAAWLRVSLPLWAEQVAQFPGECEIVVSDNASEDETPAVVLATSTRFPNAIRSHRNPENVGGNPNFFKCVDELARGEYVWVVGDDDLPLPSIIERVLDALRENADVALLFAPYVILTTEKAPPPSIEVQTLFDQSSPVFESRAAGRVGAVRDLVPLHFSCFTEIYVSILRRQDAVEAYRPSLQDAAFTTVESVSSHALYIARRLLHRPAYHLGQVCLIVSTNCSWQPYLPIQHVEHLPRIYDVFERCGAGRAIMDAHRGTAMKLTHHYVAWMLARPDTALRDQFSLRRYIWRHRRVPLLALALVRVAILVIYFKLPLGLSQKPLRIYRDLKTRTQRR